MKLVSTLRFRPGLLLLIPLTDVFCTLLVFFLLGSSLVLQSGVRVELPPSSFAVQGLVDAHVLVVSAGKKPQLILNREKITMEELPARLDKLARRDRKLTGRVGWAHFACRPYDCPRVCHAVEGGGPESGVPGGGGHHACGGTVMINMPFFSRSRSAGVPLIFPWKRPHWWSFRLVFLLIFSLFLHFAAFYLFEVVYPPSRKEILREGMVWLLLPEDQESQALLASHEDQLRVFAGYPEGAEDGAKSTVSLRLSYDNYKPLLLSLPSRLPDADLEFPDVFSSGFPPLPSALPSLPPELSDEPVLVQGRWVVDPAKPALVDSLDGAFPEDMLDVLRGSSARVHIGYDASRRIRDVGVIQGVGGEWDQALRRSLLALAVPASLPLPRVRNDSTERAWAVLTVEF